MTRFWEAEVLCHNLEGSIAGSPLDRVRLVDPLLDEMPEADQKRYKNHNSDQSVHSAATCLLASLTRELAVSANYLRLPACALTL